MDQLPLFDVPDAYAITMNLQVDGSWALHISWRSERLNWSETRRERYERLSLAEAFQTLEAVVLRVDSIES